MFELKPISSAGVPRAIAKAERYRLLNEPEEAESICLDILQVDADNQEVLVMLPARHHRPVRPRTPTWAQAMRTGCCKAARGVRAGLLCRG